MNVEAVTVEDLIELAVESGITRDIAAKMIPNFSDEERAQMASSIREMLVERTSLRARLAADETLRRAICPPADWKTPADRFDVARRALKIIEAWAEKHGVTVAAIAETMVAEYGTIAEGMRDGTIDPRNDGFDPTPSFYWLRWRLTDAIQILKSDEIRAERQRKIAEQDAAWALRGLVRCDRCFGEGGRKDWPGFTCFDCDGRGSLPKDHKHH